MRKEDCFELGFITKLHGVKGQLVLHLDVDYPDEYEELESVFLELKGNLVPFFIDDIRIQGNKAIVSFEDINSTDEAEAIKGSVAFLPLSCLPELEEGQFYFHQVLGFSVVENNQKLGTVEFFNQGSAQTLMVFTHTSGKEVLVPVSESILLGADFEKQELYVNLPEGLLEIYLED